MPEIVVEALPRTETGKNANRRLRAAGRVPGVLYGAGAQAIHLSVAPRDIGAVLRSASGNNTLFDVQVEGRKHKVIIKDFVVDPVSGHLVHADFYELALDKLIEVKVHVELTGTPKGVKVQGGQLDFVTRELEIECLPGDIPDRISVDVSELAIGQHLRVENITVPDKVRMVSEPEVVIAHVVAPRTDATAGAEAAPVAAAPAEPEVAKKGKGEEAAEKKDKK